MIDALLTRLKDGIEIRQTLSKIRQAIKDEETFSDLYNIMWDQTNLLIPLLQIHLPLRRLTDHPFR